MGGREWEGEGGSGREGVGVGGREWEGESGKPTMVLTAAPMSVLSCTSGQTSAERDVPASCWHGKLAAGLRDQLPA